MHVTTAKWWRGIAERDALGNEFVNVALPSTRSLNESTAAMVGGELLHSDRFVNFLRKPRSQQYPRRMQWRDVMSADELAQGQIVTVERVEGDIVIWRTTSGRVAACDARCPHQWAHLGSAGVVDGEELVCLSHFWRFGVTGEGSKLSGSGRRDEKSPIETMAVREHEGRLELGINDES